MVGYHSIPQQPAGTQPTNDSPYSPETVRKMNVPKGMAFFSISKGAISFTWGNSVIFVGKFLLFERQKNKYRCCSNNLGNSGRKGRCRLRHYVLKKTCKTCCRLNQFYHLWWTRAMKTLGNNGSIYRSQWLLVSESHILDTFGLFNLH